MGGGSVMPRFFVNKNDVCDTKITVTGEDARHITLSLRARPGEIFTLCDCGGNDYVCALESADKSSASFHIKEKIPNASEPHVNVTLFMSLVKADKFEDVVQKSVEMGVKSIVPVLTGRCVSRPDEKAIVSKLERWNKIAKEAAGQCGRGCIPQVMPLMDIKNAFCAMKQSEVSFVCYENQNHVNLKSILDKAVCEKAKSFSFMVGPEGGFEESEISEAQKYGIESVGLGKRILRAQTAPVCVLSAIMYATDNLS